MMGRSTSGDAAIFSTTNPSGTWIVGLSCAGARAAQERRRIAIIHDPRELLLPQDRSDDLVPDLVAVVVHVQAVLAQEFGPRPAVGGAHLRRGVDVAQQRIGFREGLDQFVRLLPQRVLALRLAIR